VSGSTYGFHVDPARVAELRTRATHAAGDLLREHEHDLIDNLGIDLTDMGDREVVRRQISDIYLGLIRTYYECEEGE
jgi:hypothetical protein